METSKQHRVGSYLPCIRPSYLSVILVFVCGILFIKNETANDRLLVLERQMAAFTEECYALRLNGRREEIQSTASSGESAKSVPISTMKYRFSPRSGWYSLTVVSYEKKVGTGNDGKEVDKGLYSIFSPYHFSRLVNSDD